jgi:Fe-S cluster assembly protein SufD
MRGVASGKARGSFKGLVYVAPDAQRTDSVQSSRNIVIGEAHIATEPQLEIYADDVKCSHGATVGQMDADAILYMRQRGLSLADAKRLQIEGFVSDVVLHSAIVGLVDALQEMLAEKFNNL